MKQIVFNQNSPYLFQHGSKKWVNVPTQQLLRLFRIVPVLFAVPITIPIYESEANSKPFCSVESATLWKLINQKSENESKVFDNTRQLLIILEQQVNTSIQDVKASLEVTIKQEIPVRENLMNKIAESLKYKVFYSLTNSQNPIIQDLIKKSSLCNTTQLCERLINFFPKPLKSMKLLFKASQHQFSMKKFFELCGNVQNTVVICKSFKGKIVGGFTPFRHKYQLDRKDWVKDQNRDSFIFSLTNNDKFCLNNINHAIMRNEQSIIFGDFEIYIKDHSNIEKSCKLRFNRFYLNNNYSACNWLKSYQSFNGSHGCRTSITEWEVWSVQNE